MIRLSKEIEAINQIPVQRLVIERVSPNYLIKMSFGERLRPVETFSRDIYGVLNKIKNYNLSPISFQFKNDKENSRLVLKNLSNPDEVRIKALLGNEGDIIWGLFG